MSKGQSLQDPFLNALRRERVPVSIYLVNGIKLQGTVESFDQFVVLLRNTVSQMVYKHAISTIVPSRNVRIGPENGHTDDRGARKPKSAKGDFALFERSRKGERALLLQPHWVGERLRSTDSTNSASLRVRPAPRVVGTLSARIERPNPKYLRRQRQGR